MRPLVVLPTYNEAENIEEVLGLVRAAAPEADVLVVDDGSPDGTADLADAWGKAHGGLRVMRPTEKPGIGSAYRPAFTAGLREAYAILNAMHADLPTHPLPPPPL
ncbi:MAG: glycosyltransferase, partial [Acidimicrobiales bacterium]|nr:glycosyltransferase [Acidimicrobiales bacterium]